jgi:hypothetical protein
MIKAQRNSGCVMAGKDAAVVVLDSTHSRAICDEIGERLRDVLGRDVPEIPPYLRRLVDRFAELERVPSPPIAPSTRAKKLELV